MAAADPSASSPARLLTFDDPRIQAEIKGILGSMQNTVIHAVIPFQFGYEAGGLADVYTFPQNAGGMAYVTGDLIGANQKPSDAGNYELVIFQRSPGKWGPDLISRLAYYTLDASLNSGETMDLGGTFGSGTAIVALIFDAIAHFQVDGHDYGLMLVLGITSEELKWKERHGGRQLIKRLKQAGVYPYTDLGRRTTTP